MRRLLLLLLVLAVPALAAGKVALLRTVSGNVSLAGKPAKKLQTLAVGDQLILAAGGSITADFLKSGLRQTVSGPATVKVAVDGFQGEGKIASDKASRMAALPDIGGQKKMGGGTVRGAEPISLRVEQTTTGPRFLISNVVKQETVPYYVSIYSPQDMDFEDFSVNNLTASEWVMPDEIRSQLKPGKTYLMKVGEKAQFDLGQEGHRMRFQWLDGDQVASLAEMERSVIEQAMAAKDPEPLVLLMAVYDEYDMAAEASEAGQQALDLAPGRLDEATTKQLAETVRRLLIEIDDTESAQRLYDEYHLKD